MTGICGEDGTFVTARLFMDAEVRRGNESESVRFSIFIVGRNVLWMLRQGKVESGSLTELALCPDPSTVSLNDVLNNRKPMRQISCSLAVQLSEVYSATGGR